jgi:LacI family transcriptional regulator
VAKPPKPDPRRPITQYDLATHLGIAQKTVSRALSGDPSVAADLRQRIEGAAQELGYRPNLSARSTKTRRFDSAMLIQVAAKSHHRLAPGIVDGIADGLASAGRPLLIERLILEQHHAGSAPPRGLSQAMVDGLIVHVDAEPSPDIERILTASNLPVVWLNRLRPADAVFPDDAGAAALMVSRLHAAGHRRIAWLDQQLGFRPAAELHYSRAARADGYREAMLAANLTPLLLTPAYDPGESGHPAWLEAQLKREKPTAIACYSSYEALAVLHTASRIGLRIPEACSLITIHHESLVAGVRIDVAALPTEALGRAAAGMLVDRIAGRRRIPSMKVPFTLIPGSTVAPPA